ncbi:hypothetical protein BMS3Abin04_01272 [bacterium BMS3Abin04]|nr:hypothetical protein BMS3Abin04_01272 [bacterium BMS3Abin04]
MLVLTRKSKEKIRIGTDIVITVITTSDNQVKIGIEAPEDVKILREELYQKVKDHTISASLNSKLNIDFNKLKINKINKR